MDENERYHSDTTRISKSGLDLINKAPAHYYSKYLDPNRKTVEPTEALITGSAFHLIVLENHKFENEYVVSSNFSGAGSQTKRRDFIELNSGKKIISVETYEKVSRMREAVQNHPLCRELLSNGVTEEQLNWIDIDTGAKCKMKADFRNSKMNIIVDLKSTEDASEGEFMRSAFKHRYHVQSAFYQDGTAMNMIRPDAFVFIAVEKDPPYLVNVFFATDEFTEQGRITYKEDLRIYTSCIQSNVWPGYAQEIKPLSLPFYAINSNK